ncbi:hypothetical protein ENHY17A_50325 [Moraxellaceae bacterium 17A]|nr:hypothetical protein ENHY17A_50325 [Moraxellaceae bacterium 17A]
MNDCILLYDVLQHRAKNRLLCKTGYTRHAIQKIAISLWIEVNSI